MIALELTEAEAIILAELLWSNAKSETSIHLRNKTQHQVLWNLECLLEKALPPDYDLRRAEQEIAEKFGG